MLLEALASGGGSDWYYTVLVKAPVGANITVDDGDEEVTAVGAGVDMLIGIPVHNPSSAYTVSVEMDGFTAPTQTVNTPATSGGISTELTFNFATINMTYDDEFRGQTATITDGTHTQTATLPAAPSNLFTVHVPYTGNWRISAEDSVDHQLFYTSPDPIPITSLTQTSNVNMFVIPNGETVLPVNDIETWLLCADIKNTGYTTLAEVLADEDVLFKVLTDDNANKYLKRSTDWINSNLIPKMTDDTHPSGEAIRSSVYSGSSAYQAFDKDKSTQWGSDTTNNGEWIGYDFGTPTVVRKIKAISGANQATYEIKIEGFDGSDWVTIDTVSWDYPNGSDQFTFVNYLDNETAYSKYRVYKNSYTGNHGRFWMSEMEFYAIPEGITENELAMQIIGADDFASDILLSDATWGEAIAESEYWKSVLNDEVPTMTSNTTPTGEAFMDKTPYNNQEAFKAYNSFAKNNYSAGPSGTSAKWGYHFPYPIMVCKFTTQEIANTSAMALNSMFKDATIEGSNDGTNYTVLHTITNQSAVSGKVYDYSFLNDTAYEYYQLNITANNNFSNYTQVGKNANFYGRALKSGVQTLLKAAGISRPYTTIDELLADHVTLQKVISSHDAIDYLVTAKSFIDAITSDATAMRYIGKRNYAADTLLADSDWGKGITESEYRNSVISISVPTMTGINTPSGVITYSSAYSASSYPPYAPFDADETNCFTPSTSDTLGNAYIGYKFTERVNITGFAFKARKDGLATVKIMASDDDFSTSVLIKDNIDVSSNDVYVPLENSETKYEYRVYMMSFNSGIPNFGYVEISKIQFYGRTDVDESKIDVYGAAGAAVQFKHNGSWENLTTLDATTDKGHAVIDATDLPVGVSKLLFKTDVAKDPDDLTADYTKEIDIFDDMIEISVMPDGALYWYGYESPYMEDMLTANGWTFGGSTLVASTRNTASLRSNAGSSQCAGISSKNKVSGNFYGVLQGVTASSNIYGYLGTYAAKNDTISKYQIVSDTTKRRFDILGRIDEYLTAYTASNRAIDIHALWYE